MTRTIGTKDDLQEALSVPRALIFLWVDWAAQAQQSQETLNQLMNLWQQAFPQHFIAVYRADLSDDQGDGWKAIGTWLLELMGRPVNPIHYNGCGALLWMTAGEIKMYSRYLAEHPVHKLLAVTRSLFDVSEPIPKQWMPVIVRETRTHHGFIAGR